MRISLVFKDGSTPLEGAVLTSMTPWSPTLVYVHHTIPGSSAGGPTYLDGQDNPVATLSGRIPLTPGRLALMRSVIGKEIAVTVTEGDVSASWDADIIQADADVSGYPAWLYFTLGLQMKAVQTAAGTEG